MAESRRGFLGRLLGETPERATRTESLSPQAAEKPAESPVESAKQSWWNRLKTGLSRSSQSLTTGIADVFLKRKLDAEALDELEDLLLKADLGSATAARVVEALSRQRLDKEVTPEEVRQVLAAEVERTLAPVAKPLEINADHRPFVILVVGVNGTGKTTTIGKLAARFRTEGKSVTLAAGDTFRAAAIEQLKIWGERANAAVVARAPGSDAAKSRLRSA